jgi:sulfur transfer protein SufE
MLKDLVIRIPPMKERNANGECFQKVTHESIMHALKNHKELEQIYRYLIHLKSKKQELQIKEIKFKNV